MCGIAALFKTPAASCPPSVLDRMRDEVAHRGPDDWGSAFFRRTGGGWRAVAPEDGDWTVGLGHRRLSILDVSRAGHQPMGYRDRFWIVYNGEVYNFIELKRELAARGHAFRSSSDTEVILAVYDEWGPDCFRRFRGMWGLVIVDLAANEVMMCRDRLGMKPLYLWSGPGLVAVGSEIKQFTCLPQFAARMDTAAAAEYVHTGYENPERSLFRDVRPVAAGSWMRLSLDTLQWSTDTYWHPERVQISVSEPEAAARLFSSKLAECVGMHLRSDVPVGCALSGGLDSSAIVATADRLRDRQADPLHTFTITFPGDPCDEREWVDAVASATRTTAHFETPDPGVFLEDLDRFVWIHDEPVGHLSMYSGYCLARLTRASGVPVTLNGQGGDEILSGYWQTYFLYLHELWQQRQLLALSGHLTGALIKGGNQSLVGQVPLMLRRYRSRAARRLRMRFDASGAGAASSSPMAEMLSKRGIARRVHEVRTMFLPRLLKWEDRNSMAFSVEGRYPFLDHELVELCLSFAPGTLYKAGWTKMPLRLGLEGVLPEKTLWRRSKFGFEAPQEKWLCGALRPHVERWLQSDRPLWDHLERPDVRRLAEETWRVGSRQAEPGQELFRLLVFDKWLEVFGPRV